MTRFFCWLLLVVFSVGTVGCGESAAEKQAAEQRKAEVASRQAEAQKAEAEAKREAESERQKVDAEAKRRGCRAGTVGGRARKVHPGGSGGTGESDSGTL